jgi:hypothetical protein
LPQQQELEISIPEIRLGFSLEDNHQGWDIADDLNLPAAGECRYIFELWSGQSVSIDLDGRGALEVLVCADDDYDVFEESGCLPCSHWWIVGSLQKGRSCAVRFRAPRTTAFDVIVTNRAEEPTRATLHINAAPEWKFEKRRDQK